MTLTVEQTPQNDLESTFVENLQTIVKDLKTDDCRTLAPIVRTLAAAAFLDMVVGCGGSHVYIHRANEFKAGEHAADDNIRFAIIRD